MMSPDLMQYTRTCLEEKGSVSLSFYFLSKTCNSKDFEKGIDAWDNQLVLSQVMIEFLVKEWKEESLYVPTEKI